MTGITTSAQTFSSFLRKHKWFILLLILIAVFQMCYYSAFEDPPYRQMMEGGDASTYANPENHVQVFLPRVPVYGALINLIRVFSGEEHLSGSIVAVQSFLYYLSVFVFYLLCCDIVSNKWVARICTLCYGCMPGFLFYNRVIRVESLSIVMMVVYLYLLYRILQKKENPPVLYSLCAALPGLMILLRPGFLFLMLIASFIILPLRHHRKQLLCYCLGLLISIGSVLGVCMNNRIQYGIFAITDISTRNQLVICKETGLYSDNADTELVEAIDQQAAWQVVVDFGEQRVSALIKSSYLSHPKQFLLYNIEKLFNLAPSSLFIHGTKSVSETFNYKQGRGYQLIALSAQLFSWFNFSYLYLLVALQLAFFAIQASKRSMFSMILWLCVVMQFGTSFIGGDAEWSRLIVPILPILIIWTAQLLQCPSLKQRNTSQLS